MTDQADGLEAALGRIREKMARTGKHLNPPAQEKDLAELEEEYGIILPPDYCAFLLHLGDGGDGPQGGLHSLWAEDGYDVDNRVLFVTVPGDLSLDYAKVPSAFIRPYDSEDARKADPQEEIRCLAAISDDGAGIIRALCVYGREYGRVLRVEGEESQTSLSTFDDFLGWYEAWLDDQLRGWEDFDHGRHMPGDEEGLMEIAASAGAAHVRLAAIESLDHRAPVLSDETVETLRRLGSDDPDREVRASATRAIKRRVMEPKRGFWSSLLLWKRRLFGQGVS